MKCKIMIFLLINVSVLYGLHAQVKSPNPWQSSHVKIGEKGEIIYIPDKDGNIIPDFSRVGYHHGDKSVTFFVPDSTIKIIYPSDDGLDSSDIIQSAINEISARTPDAVGYRGTVLLKRGVYKVSESIVIKESGVVLTGEGDNINETRIIATGKKKYPLIRIEGSGEYNEVHGSRVKIVDRFVPVGVHSFLVESGAHFKKGDRIIIFRPGTWEWIHALKMDQIVERPGTKQWNPKEYNLNFEREITEVKGNRIFIDNPIVMQLEDRFGGGEIFKYTFDGRISEVGVSHMYLESEYIDEEDTAHGWIGILLDKVENCWVTNVTTRYFGYGAVSCGRYAKNVTVRDCRCFEPKSIITGGMRYSFNNNGQQNLFMNCQSKEGRHDFVTGARTCGPNVFYNCFATQAYADIGPHHRWSVGTLYDNVITDGEINVQDRGNMGSGHGWAGVTQVLWNCTAKGAAVQKPWVSGNNYNFGMKGEHNSGHFKEREDGVWEGQNEKNVIPCSLYLAQLLERQKK